MNCFKVYFSLLLIGSSFYALQAQQTPVVVSDATKSNIKKEAKKTLTLYTNNICYFKDFLVLTLQQGLNHVHLLEFPGSLHPQTMSFAAQDPNCHVDVFKNTKTSDQKNEIDLYINAQKNQEASYYMGYLMEDLGWSMHYTAEVSSKQNSLNLTGWVKISNGTPITFEDAHIHLIEGAAPLDASLPSSEAKSYELTNSYTLKPGDQYLRRVQIQNIPLKKDYRVYVGGSFLQDIQSDVFHPPIETWISFDNTQENGMGIGLPKGQLMLFQRNAGGASQLLGKTILAATLSNQTLNIKLPSTFAIQSEQSQELIAKLVTCEIEQTDFKRLGEDMVEMGFRILLNNKSSNDQTIKIILNLPKEGDWSLLREQTKHESSLDREVIWSVTVPSKKDQTDGQTEFKYRLRLQTIKS